MSRFSIKKETQIEQRKNELMDKFRLNKLEYKDRGLCYTYVHYGKPELSVIIKNEKQKQENLLILQIYISKKLKEKNINFKDKIHIFNKYIKNINIDLSK